MKNRMTVLSTLSSFALAGKDILIQNENGTFRGPICSVSVEGDDVVFMPRWLGKLKDDKRWKLVKIVAPLRVPCDTVVLLSEAGVISFDMYTSRNIIFCSVFISAPGDKLDMSYVKK